MSANKPHRGLDPKREIDDRLIYDDPRSAFERFAGAIGDRKVAAILIGLLALLMLFLPVSAMLALPAVLFVWVNSVDQSEQVIRAMPMRLPQDARIIDKNDPLPQRKKFRKARGVIYLGNRMGDDAEIWQGTGDAVRHWLVFGTTGAGKAQPEHALVLTPDGWQRIGELSPGDWVCSPRGEPIKIVSVHPQGPQTIHQLHFSDGRTPECTADHLWALTDGRVLETSALVVALARGERPQIVLGSPLGGTQSLAVPPDLLADTLTRCHVAEDAHGAFRLYCPTPAIAVSALHDLGALSGLSAPTKCGGADWLVEQAPDAWRPWWSALARGALPADALESLTLSDKRALLRALRDSAGVATDTVIELEVVEASAGVALQRLFWSLGCICYRIEQEPDRRASRPKPWRLQAVHGSFDGLLCEGISDQPGYIGLPLTRIQVLSTQLPCICLSLETSDGLYITNDYAVTHNTNTLLSVCVANALAMSSGVFYSDAKASPDLAFKVASMGRQLGRDDDTFFINYITGSMTVKAGERRRMTNTSNPFEDGPADSKVQVMSGLMPKSEGDNAIFGERAVALLTAIMYPLVDLRDAGHLNLGVNEIRKALNFSTLADYATNERLPISGKSRSILQSYLNSLPGLDSNALKQAARDGELASFQIPQEASRQFGFAQMYFTRAISSLSDTYGHIYWVNMGEVDFMDAVLNRRIVVIMLPALEKSLQELGNLGKINLSSLRDAMKVGLGRGIEGDKAQVIDAVPTVAKVPVTIVLDEVAYQLVEGFAVTAAQARGLNIQVIFAGQDYAGIKKASEGEAQQIVENTVTKVFMKLEGPYETLEMVTKIAGEANVAMSTGGHQIEGSPVPDRFSNQAYQYQTKNRITVREMRDLIEGEAYVTFGNSLILASMAHADLHEMRNLRINRYLRIKAPLDSEMPEAQKVIKGIANLVKQRKLRDESPVTEVPLDYAPTAVLFDAMRRAKLGGPTKGMMALCHELDGFSGEGIAVRPPHRNAVGPAPAIHAHAGAAPGELMLDELDIDDAIAIDDVGALDDMQGASDDRAFAEIQAIVDQKVPRSAADLNAWPKEVRPPDEDPETPEPMLRGASQSGAASGPVPSMADTLTTGRFARLQGALREIIDAPGDAMAEIVSDQLAEEAAELLRGVHEYPTPPMPLSKDRMRHKKVYLESMVHILDDKRGEKS